jgi:hypothetical protein
MATAAITGTVGDGATEAEIVAGAGTIVITLTGDTLIAAGGGGMPVVDGFSTDTIANYTQAAGSWSVTGGVLHLVTTGANSCLQYSLAAASTISQYGKIKIIGGSADTISGIIFRYTNSSSPFYVVLYEWNADRVRWGNCDTPGAGFQVIGNYTSAGLDAGHNFGVTVTGTGTGTVVSIWKDVTADAPTNATTWDARGADYTLTDDPGAYAVDAGLYIGLFATADTAGHSDIDNFSGGDIP